MKRNRLIFLLLMVLSTIGQQLLAQNTSNDSILKFSNYIDLVLKNSPISKLAELEVKKAKANLLSVKGNFDPSLGYQFNEKSFEGNRYYRISQAKLNVPTGLGPSLFMSYDYAQGAYINPESKTPNEGLGNIGISIPILRGLLIDEARTELRQAKLIQNASSTQKQLILNQLIVNATIQYWYWFEAYNKLEVSLEGLNLAKVRLNGIVESAKQGDEPYIDTVEANIQYQNRILNYQKHLAEYQINQLQMSFFLWEDSTLLSTRFNPPAYVQFDKHNPPIIEDQKLINNIQNHPELIEKELKLGILALDKKMAWENFKPQVDVIYKPISSIESGSSINYNPNNYNLGMLVKVPILYRKERGSLQKIKVAQEQTLYELDIKRREIFNKAKGSYFEIQALSQQIEIQRNNVKNTLQLLNAEQQKMSVGESSVFMMNIRENNYLDSEIKLVELMSKYEISLTKCLYFANEL